MSFSYKLKEMLSKENLTAKEFSGIAGIAYATTLRYTSGKRTPTVELINTKILSIPRFEKYRSLLLGTDEPIDKRLDLDNPDHQQFLHLLEKIHEKGLETEALGILRALASQQGKDSPDAE